MVIIIRIKGKGNNSKSRNIEKAEHYYCNIYIIYVCTVLHIYIKQYNKKWSTYT